ncbi:MAG: DUF1569 domain-containing protein [Acidobacteria bacterium]|nr:DUF1569 domain-containing protein [Acidobacteriota bacterium]
MRSLHDASYRSHVVQRVQTLRPDSERRWGKMTVDQMLWHVSDALANAIGELRVEPQKPPLPRGLLKFMILNLPWGKNAPTMPVFVPKRNYDFEAERTRCLRLIDRMASMDLDGEWPAHPMLGRLTGSEISRLHAKHLHHHLTQFGV